MYFLLIVVLPFSVLLWSSFQKFYAVPSMEALQNLTLDPYRFIFAYPNLTRTVWNSVALSFARRCARGQTPFELTDLVLSNGNIFLPLSNLTEFQRLTLNPETGPVTVAALTPELLAAGCWGRPLSRLRVRWIIP